MSLQQLRRSAHATSVLPPPDSAAGLCARAWHARRRGDQRRALIALREAAHSHSDNARLWALYGAQCWRVGRREDAQVALGHARWLWQRRREAGRAEALRCLLLRLDSQTAA